MNGDSHGFLTLFSVLIGFLMTLCELDEFLCHLSSHATLGFPSGRTDVW